MQEYDNIYEIDIYQVDRVQVQLTSLIINIHFYF